MFLIVTLAIPGVETKMVPKWHHNARRVFWSTGTLECPSLGAFDTVHFCDIALRSSRLEHLAFLLVVGNGLERRVHIIISSRITPHLSIDESQMQVKRDPTELFRQTLDPVLRIEDNRVFNRHC